MSFDYISLIYLKFAHDFGAFEVYVIFYRVFIFCLILNRDFIVNLKCLESCLIRIQKLLIVFILCLVVIDLCLKEHQEPVFDYWQLFLMRSYKKVNRNIGVCFESYF